jgi:very-short-patch-repair endonuclease
MMRERRWMAAVLACGPGAVLSHRSAAALWRIGSDWNGPVEVATARSTRSRPGIRRHTARLPADEVSVERGIPVTTVPRTLFDLAAVLPLDAVEKAMREAEYLRLHDRLSLRDLLARRRGYRGSRAIRICLARRREMKGFTRSPLEDLFAAFLERASLPRPQVNPWIRVGGRQFQVDCLWSKQRVIVELDGRAAHATDSAFERDRERDRVLRVAGYGVTRITWRQLRDEPTAIAVDLRALLGGPVG